MNQSLSHSPSQLSEIQSCESQHSETQHSETQSCESQLAESQLAESQLTATQATETQPCSLERSQTKAEATPSGKVFVAVFDESGWRTASVASQDQATTLLAVASDDPGCWKDLLLLWPRYCCPRVPDSAAGSEWNWADANMASVMQAVSDNGRWLVMDLVQKRILTGKQFRSVGREQVVAMRIGETEWPLSVTLPRWWEIHEASQPAAVAEPQTCMRMAPISNRQVLFGDALILDLAQRISAIAFSPRWHSSDARNNPRRRHALTVEVHRDWLLTSRLDLVGKSPREMLHGGMDWHDELVAAQRRRYECGLPIVAVPPELSNLENAPMGREEVCMYFDMCRELIAAGWSWAADPENSQISRNEQKIALRRALFDRKSQWLQADFEGDSPPEFILECSRRRVPRGEGIEIVGMDARQNVVHAGDCNCPMCDMMASGLFGACFNFIDGHHLELDEEFAFSLCETRAEWEDEQEMLGLVCEEDDSQEEIFTPDASQH